MKYDPQELEQSGSSDKLGLSLASTMSGGLALEKLVSNIISDDQDSLLGYNGFSEDESRSRSKLGCLLFRRVSRYSIHTN